MDISQDLLEYVFDLIYIHQPETLTGTYDGELGEIVLTFVGDSVTYTQAFEYTGYSVNAFRELLCQAAGECVKRHNVNVGIPSREEFIAAVTEEE